MGAGNFFWACWKSRWTDKTCSPTIAGMRWSNWIKNRDGGGTTKQGCSDVIIWVNLFSHDNCQVNFCISQRQQICWKLLYMQVAQQIVTTSLLTTPLHFPALHFYNWLTNSVDQNWPKLTKIDLLFTFNVLWFYATIFNLNMADQNLH